MEPGYCPCLPSSCVLGRRLTLAAFHVCLFALFRVSHLICMSCCPAQRYQPERGLFLARRVAFNGTMCTSTGMTNCIKRVLGMTSIFVWHYCGWISNHISFEIQDPRTSFCHDLKNSVSLDRARVNPSLLTFVTYTSIFFRLLPLRQSPLHLCKFAQPGSLYPFLLFPF